MTALGILFIISGNIIYVGLVALKAFFEELFFLISRQVPYQKKHDTQIIMFPLLGFIVGIIGAILYYQVCAATIKNILMPHHPVEEPVPYGISMILISLVFSGGFATAASIGEGKGTSVIWIKGPVVVAVIVLVVYLLLKAPMILP
jgi:hypothetical protein